MKTTSAFLLLQNDLYTIKPQNNYFALNLLCPHFQNM